MMAPPPQNSSPAGPNTQSSKFSEEACKEVIAYMVAMASAYDSAVHEDLSHLKRFGNTSAEKFSKNFMDSFRIRKIYNLCVWYWTQDKWIHRTRLRQLDDEQKNLGSLGVEQTAQYIVSLAVMKLKETGIGQEELEKVMRSAIGYVIDEKAAKSLDLKLWRLMQQI